MQLSEICTTKVEDYLKNDAKRVKEVFLKSDIKINQD